MSQKQIKIVEIKACDPVPEGYILLNRAARRLHKIFKSEPLKIEVAVKKGGLRKQMQEIAKHKKRKGAL